MATSITVIQRSVAIGAACCLLWVGVQATPAAKVSRLKKGKSIDYNRDIRPILANNCFKCHGHDPAGVMAGLRLDHRESAVTKLEDGKTAIVPGKPELSEMIRRINAGDDERMPPPFTHKTLSEADKKILTTWVQEGAEYKEHWAFVPPVRHAPPKVVDEAWVKNDIDRFILAQLESSHLKPSPEADKPTLLRRLYLDIIGLPPSPAELDAFMADKSPDAYEKVVDKLLASARYGERMAMDWLDAARYADSNGYQADYERYQWRWRDWVIDAYNQNMPYDRFIMEQLAGDMMPNPTLSQRIATGFSRNHRINTEGGVIAEEWRVETVIDRVETTSTAFLGLTSGCARCHDHKYDPITQKDFYRLFAYFNNVPESGTGEERPVNHPPLIKAPTPTQTSQLAAIDERLKVLDNEINASIDKNVEFSSTMTTPETKWPEALLASQSARWEFKETPQAIGRSLLQQPKIMGKPGSNPGRSTGAVVTNKDNWLDLGQAGDFDNTDSFSYSAWVFPEDGNGAPFGKMDPSNDYRGWDLFMAGGQVMVHVINKWPVNALKVRTKMTVPLKQWSHIAATYDGSMKPEGLKVYINGKAVETEVEVDKLSGTTRTTVPLTVGRRSGENAFNGQIDDLQLYSRVVTPEEATWIADVNPAKPLLAIPVDKRTMAQKRDITRMMLIASDAAFAKTSKKRDAAARERQELDDQIPTLMVMDEMAKPRDCFVLTRGQYDKPAEKVTAGVPEFLPPIPKGVPNNRLGFAAWVASPENPLTARVAVNRLWERLFGTGIVATSEDFGTRAEFPSHPELLDWLATEFVRLKWDNKALIKEVVMSATYRQSSVVTPEILGVDPSNRLLARGPRFRLQAEMIRDQALEASGLLVNRVGGPSVRPYQPKGIWDETNFYGNLRNYMPDNGPGLYRRSMYTIWKRTAAPPNMLLFDAPTRETCRIRRARTDTPLQALTLMNDETFLEASRVLAQHAIAKSRDSVEGQLRFAFKSVLCREPKPSELEILKGGYEKRLAKFKKDPLAAKGIASQGASPTDKSIDPAELAAMSVVCSTLFNLDEAVTKE